MLLVDGVAGAASVGEFHVINCMFNRCPWFTRLRKDLLICAEEKNIIQWTWKPFLNSINALRIHVTQSKFAEQSMVCLLHLVTCIFLRVTFEIER